MSNDQVFTITHNLPSTWGIPVAHVVKNLLQCRRPGFNSWVGKMPWRWECKPLQYSCLENSIDRGAWWTSGLQSMGSQSDAGPRN